MSQHHVTAKGKCAYCGAQLRQCIECSEWFIATSKAHVYCRARCRTRRCRALKAVDKITGAA